ncbi:MurR/RpiR family transcriptional regulator [Enterococcus faecalis]
MRQNIILSIQDYKERLPLSEKKIAEYILEHTAEVLSLNAQELAKKAGSSPAAIIRFCHSIHVNGFTELKLLLSANLGQMTEEMYTEVEKNESTEDIKKKLQARVVHVIERTNQSLKETAIEEAVTLIESAEIIYVYGLGASSLVAQDIFQKFTRLGRNVFTSLDHHLFASALGTSEKTGVLIAVSNSGGTLETNRLAKMAKAKKIPVIGITTNKESLLAATIDVLLLTTGQEDVPLRSAATVSLTAQLYAVDVLFFAYAAKNYNSTLEKIQTSRENVNLLKE